MKRIDIISCVETFANTIKVSLSLNGETSQQNEKTCTSYSKMFNANDSSMNGTGNAYGSIQHKRQTKPQKVLTAII